MSYLTILAYVISYILLKVARTTVNNANQTRLWDVAGCRICPPFLETIDINYTLIFVIGQFHVLQNMLIWILIRKNSTNITRIWFWLWTSCVTYFFKKEDTSSSSPFLLDKVVCWVPLTPSQTSKPYHLSPQRFSQKRCAAPYRLFRGTVLAVPGGRALTTKFSHVRENYPKLRAILNVLIQLTLMKQVIWGR